MQGQDEEEEEEDDDEDQEIDCDLSEIEQNANASSNMMLGDQTANQVFHNSREISANQNNPAILRNDSRQIASYGQEQEENESEDEEELVANGENQDEEEYEEDDGEIGEMKAKFNQILSNFDNEHHLQQQKSMSTGGSLQNYTGPGTGYFVGGAP